MRTTVEIPDDIRNELVHLASERGLRGYSQIVEEALRAYLAKEQESRVRREAALSCRGAWSGQQTQLLQERIAAAWRRWES